MNFNARDIVLKLTKYVLRYSHQKMSTFLISRFCDEDILANETKVLKDTFGEEIYFDTANSVERTCPKGQTGDNINALKTCKHSFELIENKDKTEIKLKRSYSGEKLNADKFCLINYNGTGILDRTATICMDDGEIKFE